MDVFFWGGGLTYPSALSTTKKVLGYVRKQQLTRKFWITAYHFQGAAALSTNKQQLTRRFWTQSSDNELCIPLIYCWLQKEQLPLA
mmetsp:Transcript_41134/g.64319  ORF Transcript_41134/g.64319 Transcript_41134/m.64319 type:complete len:86 (+) Transcript_41134:198-455(+)